MTIGVIGLGSIGERHVRNVQKLYPRATIDILTKRKNWPDAKKNTRLIQSSAQFYSTKHDVYFITNETHKHAATLLHCLKQKPRGIFVEKPLSHSLAQLTTIQKIAAHQKTALFVAYNFQFFNPLLHIKQILKKKTIGSILSMHVSAGKDLKIWRARDYRTSYSSDPKRGGGVVLDLIHEINYPAWLLAEPLRFASGFSGKISDLEIASEDFAEGFFVSQSGVPVLIHLDYLRTPGHRSCEILGTKGTLRWDLPLTKGTTTSTIRIDTGHSSRTIRVRSDWDAMYKAEASFFLKKIATNESFSNIEEALRDMHNALKLRTHHHGSTK